MQVQTIPYGQIPQLSRRDVAYATQDPSLRLFYKYPPTLDAFTAILQDKSTATTPREALVDVLREQYATRMPSAVSEQQIGLLKQDNTFTIVTAHQPSLFTGPLYFILKICSAIHLARAVQAANPGYNVLPVFVMGGEDHDFEEINHLHLYGKSITWQTEAAGPVAWLESATLGTALEELQALLGESESASSVFRQLEAAYTRHTSYGASTLEYVHQLFADYGLLVLDMNNAVLKRHFIPIMREELLEQSSHKLVTPVQAELETLGYGAQAHARDINLFYIQPGLRERIVQEADGSFAVLNTDKRWSRSALLEELDAHPEHFSPNVVLRPLYQETILPNLAYVGGGGEIAYWLERKAQFEHFGVNFPMLVRRNSLMWVDAGSQKRLEKLNLAAADLFMDTDALIRQFVEAQSTSALSIDEEKQHLSQLFNSIADKARQIDPTLASAIEAEYTRQAKTLEGLESRLLRAEKQKHDTAINQIRSLKDKFTPGGGLQERHDNFIPLYVKHGPALLKQLVDSLNPLEEGFVVVME